ncbi:MAG TPA: SpoIIE family protein phosphatase [Candidatus Saccharimonadales bacterium]|nr:SpoIIE family protein phosphatase [Candidatus Saccharimonadales bacterium]
MPEPPIDSLWKTLWEASRVLDSLLSLEDLMPVINRLVCQTLECECASLLVVDEEVGVLRPQLAVGRTGEAVEAILWSPGRGIAGRVLSRNCAERLNDISQDPDADFAIEASLGVQVRNLVAAPLGRDGVPVGVIEAINKLHGEFTEADLQFLHLLAFDIASAVDNARIYDRERRERSQNEILAHVAARAARSVVLRDVLEDILDAVEELVPYNAAELYLLAPDGSGGLSQLVARGYAQERPAAAAIKLGTGLVGWVCQTGHGVIVPNVARDPRYVNTREETRSEIVAPVHYAQRVIGAFNLESDKLNAFGERDLELLGAFAAHAAIAVERARLYEELEEKQRLQRELSFARSVQQAFQPRRSPELPGLDLAGHNESSDEVSGDYYDFIHIHESHYGLALADVSGKGVPAALIMASFRASLIAEIRNNYAIRTVMAKVNRLLVESLDPGQFVTAFYGVLDTATRRLTYANAGHNPPLLLRAEGRTEQLTSTGPLLGSFAGSTFRERTADLHPGDVLLIYTDGLTEAMNAAGEEFGVARAEARLAELRSRPAAEICRGLLDAVREFAGQRWLRDDVTLIVLRSL